MAFCFDLDGTITTQSGFGASEKSIPWWIIWLVLLIYKPKINVPFLRLIQEIKKKETVLIFTARPERTKLITIKYLEKNNVPFDKIFFLGNGKKSAERKIKKAKEEGVKVLYDNNKKVVEMAKKEGIASFLI